MTPGAKYAVGMSRPVRLHMTLLDEQGSVVASAEEPFEVGRFDLAAARQGMRKLLAGLGGIEDSTPG